MSSVLSLDAPYYEALKRLTLELAGVNLGADHAFLVETRLSALARREGFESLDSLINELFKTGESRLAVQVVSALLERDTHFNKDSESFKRFTDIILPQLYAVRGGGKIRLLSFGCASGQEAYTMAMAYDQMQEDYPDLEIEILGIDYPSLALDRAKEGRYTHFDIQRGLSAKDLITYFEPVPEPQTTDWRVKDSLKERVKFEDVHLLSSLGNLPKFHAVLFRGSLPHYSAPAQIRVLRGLSSLVMPTGYLLLGSDEKLGQVRFGFKSVPSEKGLYQKEEKVVAEAPYEPVPATFSA